MKLTEEEIQTLREEMDEAAKKMDDLLNSKESKETDDETFRDDGDASNSRRNSI